MASDWRERLRELRNWLTRQSDGKSPEITPSTVGAPLALNLGIDFGTSFTKVAFRDLGTEETGIVTFGATSADRAMVSSVVKVSTMGTLSLGTGDSSTTADAEILYLKMRLADMALPDRPKTMPDHIPELCGLNFNSKEGVCALSSWFLATVIVRAQQWVLQHEASRAKGRTIQWSANIGVPVEYYDSPAIGEFREVLTVAWAWVKANEIPTQIDTLIKRYRETSEQTNPEDSDCHAVPEIAAAVQSFVTSRQAMPGIYVYFDIGGGTLDGVAFDFTNWLGERRINFYSGKVAPLGIAAVAGRCLRDAQVDGIEAALLDDMFTAEQLESLQLGRKDIQKLVGNVICTAKRKDGRDWQRNAIQNTSRARPKIGHLDPKDMAPLIVFIGGGGAGSKWYQGVIHSTHEDFGHLNAGIPPYKLVGVANPPDLNMNALGEAEFGRFAVAYGLSVPVGEGPEIGLPSEFGDAERARVRQQPNVVDYSDSKEVYD